MLALAMLSRTAASALLYRILKGLACALAASGCGPAIMFAGSSSVSEDGSLVRTTEIRASSDHAYDEALAHYEFPDGGTWRVADEAGIGAPYDESTRPAVRYKHIWSLTRSYEPGEMIGSDFVRYGSDRSQAARNSLRVRARNFWLFDTYRYDESFKDIVTEDSFIDAVETLYRLSARAIARRIADRQEAAVSESEALERIDRYARPAIDEFESHARVRCFGPRSSTETCFEPAEWSPVLSELVETVDDEELMARKLAEIFPPRAQMSSDAWLEALRLDVIGNATSEIENSEETRQILKGLLGVHGFILFESYPFEITLTLPGDYVDSNADARADGKLRWLFESEDFVLSNYALYAKSRVIHWNRLLFILIVTIAGMAIITSSAEQRQRKTGVSPS